MQNEKGGVVYAVIPDPLGESGAPGCRWHSQTWFRNAVSMKKDPSRYYKSVSYVVIVKVKM
jgi:hypothetical protein